MITAAVTELFRDLERGALAVTATRRLARQAEQRYAEWKRGEGAGAWATPRIRVYEDWLLEAWRARAAHLPGAPHLLSDDQELLLWEQVIRQDTAGTHASYLLQLTGTARTARQSWRRIHQWDLDWRRLRDHRSADSEALVHWSEAVGAMLQDNRWIAPAQVPGRLIANPQAWPDLAPQIWWMGFDPVPSELARLMETLRDLGVRQRHYRNPGVHDRDAATVECLDAEDQWHLIARWARRELSVDPEAALAVVCPDLQGQRDRIEDILEDVLHPELAWRVDAPRTFHISLGRSLADYPIVKTALDLLQWTGRRIPFEVLSRALRSPYLGGPGLAGRLELELLLRRQRQESFTLRYLARLARRVDGLEGFAARIEAGTQLPFPESAAPAEWAALFSEWLGGLGWPGERSLDSHEFQTLNAWREQLAGFAGLGVVRQRWTLGDARRKLSSAVSMRTLQFHDDQAPLQVMGAAEAAGLWFDKLWLADMSDAVWPPSARPDPFIPVSLQKARGMPEASAQSVLEHTAARTEDLLAGAAWARVSFVATQEGAPAALSPMFTGLPRAGRPDGGESQAGRTQQLAASPAPLELIDDQRAPAVAAPSLHGGVALVSDQAKCPFRALAHHRLKARELNQAEPGLDAGQRGTLVHDVARRLWRELRDQRTLLSMQESDVKQVVAESVAGAVAELFADSPFQKRFLEIERSRLEALFLEWLALEGRRGTFRVLDTELETRLELGGVRFRVRVDRVDELADGRHLVIDYKTGQLARSSAWTQARIEEPQLPMYALCRTDPLAALAQAGIRRGECELRGIAEDAPGLPTLQSVSELGFDSMSRLQHWWRSVLAELVAEYVGGVARVDPRSADICRLCDAVSLCRIFERDQLVEDKTP